MRPNKIYSYYKLDEGKAKLYLIYFPAIDKVKIGYTTKNIYRRMIDHNITPIMIIEGPKEKMRTLERFILKKTIHCQTWKTPGGKYDYSGRTEIRELECLPLIRKMFEKIAKRFTVVDLEFERLVKNADENGGEDELIAYVEANPYLKEYLHYGLLKSKVVKPGTIMIGNFDESHLPYYEKYKTQS